MPDYTWITAPPIRELDDDACRQAIAAMKKNMTGWGPVAVPKKPLPPYADPAPGQSPQSVRKAQLERLPPDIDANDWQPAQRTFQERWNNRLKSTRDMFNFDFTGGHTVGYFLGGAPVAVMCLIESDPVLIADLVCHPGSENGGGIMIEYAVNRAVGENGNPIVTLVAADEEAGKAYEHLGFAPDSPGRPAMTLDASTSDKWASSGNRWHLAKFAMPQRYASLPDPAAPGMA